MAKHRAPRYVRTKKVIAKAPVAAGATAIGLGVLSTSPANAATTHDWSGVANCESSGNWSIDTGNGFYGGLQFTQSTWAGYGGTAFAARADQASPAQQVQIAEKVLAGQGVGAWPVCGKYLTGGSTAAAAQRAAAAPAAAAAARTAPVPAASAPTAPAPTAPAPTRTAPVRGDDADQAAGHGRHAASRADYTVARGDTVGKIAAAHAEAWQQLYQDNRAVIGANPNLIFPGQRLRTAGAAAAPAAPAPVTKAPVTKAPVTKAPAAQAPAAAAPVAQAPVAQAPVALVRAAAPAAATRVAAAPVAASSAGVVAEKVALAQVGRPYVSGGESPSGFDCSGLVQYAYTAAGVSLPRTTGAQISAGTAVSEANLQVGDLVFFYGGSHVGIYVGNGEVVHAPVPGQTVTVIKIAYMPYYAARHIG